MKASLLQMKHLIRKIKKEVVDTASTKTEEVKTVANLLENPQVDLEKINMGGELNCLKKLQNLKKFSTNSMIV